MILIDYCAINRYGIVFSSTSAMFFDSQQITSIGWFHIIPRYQSMNSTHHLKGALDYLLVVLNHLTPQKYYHHHSQILDRYDS
jgi:hypothetical protein